VTPDRPYPFYANFFRPFEDLLQRDRTKRSNQKQKAVTLIKRDSSLFVVAEIVDLEPRLTTAATEIYGLFTTTCGAGVLISSCALAFLEVFGSDSCRGRGVRRRTDSSRGESAAIF